MHQPSFLRDAHRRLTLAAVAVYWAATFAILVGAGMFRSLAPARFSALAWGVTSSLGLLAITGVFLRWEGRSVDSVGLRARATSVARFAIGAAVGATLYAAQILILVSVADVRVAVAPEAASALPALALITYLMLAIMEEVGFRGYALRRLEEQLGRPAALGLGALAFGLLHLAYGWTPGAALIGAGAGALVFGMAALVSRGLAVPIGMHAAWNLAGWSVGEKDGAGIWHLIVAEPAARAATVGSVSYLLAMTLGFVGCWAFGRSSSSRSSSSLT